MIAFTACRLVAVFACLNHTNRNEFYVVEGELLVRICSEILEAQPTFLTVLDVDGSEYAAQRFWTVHSETIISPCSLAVGVHRLHVAMIAHFLVYLLVMLLHFVCIMTVTAITDTQATVENFIANCRCIYMAQ